MKEKELKLSQQLMELQKRFNEVVVARDEWVASYHGMRRERDKYLHRAMELERYISDRLGEQESFPDIS